MLHEAVDLPYWISLFPLDQLRTSLKGRPQHEQLGGMQINSPYHLAVVEQIRAECLSTKRPKKIVPTDVFIWNLGEPHRPDITKIGGVPYRPSYKPWPKLSSGKPLTFISQINFTDSKDITVNLPGDILLIFSETGEGGVEWFGDDKSTLVCEWVSFGDFPITQKNEIPKTMWEPLPMFGSIFRTYDFPDSAAIFSDDLLPILESTKINGEPVWLQDSCERPGRFLCSVASVKPEISQKLYSPKLIPYPYLNRAEPIYFDEWLDSHALCFGDMGLLNIFLDEQGQTTWDIQAG